jgi:protein-L-isoaspartate(D-aspartate) O-methyltransferase
MSDARQHRINMVDGQVRPSDITDRRIIRAMLEVAREEFVPPELRALAYRDDHIALGTPGRVMLAPRVFAKLVQLAALGDNDSVLVIASGTGYGAAVLGQFAGQVVALESDPGLHATALRLLEQAQCSNVRAIQGPLADGSAEDGPYDVILIEGAVGDVPPHLLGQLKDGGRLVTVHLNGVAGQGTLWRRSGRTFGQASGFDAATPALQEFARKQDFAL